MSEKPCILIVDDESDIVELLADFLETDYTVVCCTSIVQAREKIKTTRFDAIITDLHLPDCADKTSVKWIREFNLSAPILLITGQDEYDPTVQTAMTDGAQGMIKKPFSLDSVEASIRQILSVKMPA